VPEKLALRTWPASEPRPVLRASVPAVTVARPPAVATRSSRSRKSRLRQRTELGGTRRSRPTSSPSMPSSAVAVVRGSAGSSVATRSSVAASARSWGARRTASTRRSTSRFPPRPEGAALASRARSNRERPRRPRSLARGRSQRRLIPGRSGYESRLRPTEVRVTPSHSSVRGFGPPPIGDRTGRESRNAPAFTQAHPRPDPAEDVVGGSGPGEVVPDDPNVARPRLQPLKRLLQVR